MSPSYLYGNSTISLSDKFHTASKESLRVLANAPRTSLQHESACKRGAFGHSENELAVEVPLVNQDKKLSPNNLPTTIRLPPTVNSGRQQPPVSADELVDEVPLIIKDTRPNH